jgi:hypothetical protein
MGFCKLPQDQHKHKAQLFALTLHTSSPPPPQPIHMETRKNDFFNPVAAHSPPRSFLSNLR